MIGLMIVDRDLNLNEFQIPDVYSSFDKWVPYIYLNFKKFKYKVWHY